MTAPAKAIEYSGAVLDTAGNEVGTCFQVAPGLLVTAAHVCLDEDGAARAGVVVRPLGGGAALTAVVAARDDVNDLAVLRTEGSFEGSVSGFYATDSVPSWTTVAVTGFAMIADDRPHEFSSTHGTWDGLGSVDGVRLGEMTAPGLMRGMSGAAVVDARSGGVVGVVVSRYNSPDRWLTNRVWVARTESLAQMDPAVTVRPRPLMTGTPESVWARRLPPRRAFVGRHRSLERLLGIASTGRSNIAIRALGGQGKTALAEELVHVLADRDPDLRIFWPRTEPQTPTFDECLDDLLDLMGQPYARRLHATEKVDLIRRQAAQEPSIFVFDSWEKLEVDRDFVELLATLSGVATNVVTTRTDPNSAARIKQYGVVMSVVDLHDEDPGDLSFFDAMNQLYGNERSQTISDAEKGSILRLAAGNALTLQWIISELGSGQRASGLIRQLGDSTSPPMERIFAGIWARLIRREKLTLVALAEFASPPTIALLARVVDVPVAELQRVTRALVGRSLVSVGTGTDRVTAHPLTLEFVRNAARSRPWSIRRARRDFRTTMLAFCREHGGDEWSWDKFDQLDAELPNVWKLFETTHEPRPVIRPVELRNLLTLFLSIRGHWDRRLELASAAVADARTRGDRLVEARIRVYDVCYIHLKRAEWDEAEAEARWALPVFRDAGDLVGLANVNRHLGRIAHERGNFEAAERLYRQSHDLYVASDEEYGAFLDWDLGDLSATRGQPERAAEYFERAYDASRDRQGKSQAIHAMAAGALGDLAMAAGDLSRARRLIEEEHVIAHAIGRADEMAISSFRLGSLFVRSGERHAGAALLVRALELARQLGDSGLIERIERVLPDDDPGAGLLSTTLPT